MVFAIVMSVVAGVFGVLQAGMNKGIADHLGFTTSLLMNGFFFLFFNSLFFFFVYVQPKMVSSEFAIQLSFEQFRWWWVIPGLMGFLLVMGLAVAIGRIGAVQTFVVCIAAQIAASIGWDFWVENSEISGLRLVGAGVTLVGAIIATIA